nr:GGDEF domain [uncultured organism]
MTQTMVLPKRFYLPRCLGLSMGFLAVFASLPPLVHGRLVLALLVAYCFVWPHMAYGLARISARPVDAERRSMLVDALASGFFAGVMGFNPIPSVCIVSMVTMNNMAMGGPRFMRVGLAATGAGAALAWLVFKTPFDDTLTHVQIVACLPLLVLYPLSLGYVSYLTAVKLTRHRNQLSLMSKTDYLTGLSNRAAFNDILAAWVAAPAAAIDRSVVALVDVDGFKAINDQHGHLAGDRALQSVAAIMTSCVGKEDTVARYGGDEFCIILRNVGQAEAARTFEHMCKLAQPTRAVEPGEPIPTLSIGAALYDPRAATGELWIHRADGAMYLAKKGGRNQVVFAD